uniref:Uncharacterized protein n=1 Tax=Haemonchus contortus TaxID=6289 RepID=A0A7I4Y424_HAECO
MAYSAFLDCSSINNDIRYGELFSLFDNAQEYFTVSHGETFDKLLSKVNQLPVKSGRTKICCEQLKRRNSAKLNSVDEQLEHVYSTREQLESQQEDLRKTKVKQERELEECRTQREDVTRRYLKVSKNCAQLDREQSVVLKEVLEGSIKRLVTKLTAKEANLFTSAFPDEDGQIPGSGDDENME